jgi:hypothetical protein
MVTEEEIIKRLTPIVGFMDNKTGLLYVQTPTSSFKEFIDKVKECEND